MGSGDAGSRIHRMADRAGAARKRESSRAHRQTAPPAKSSEPGTGWLRDEPRTTARSSMKFFRRSEPDRPDLASALDRLDRLGVAEPSLRDAVALQSAILRT